MRLSPILSIDIANTISAGSMSSVLQDAKSHQKCHFLTVNYDTFWAYFFNMILTKEVTFLKKKQGACKIVAYVLFLETRINQICGLKRP